LTQAGRQRPVCAKWRGVDPQRRAGRGGVPWRISANTSQPPRRSTRAPACDCPSPSRHRLTLHEFWPYVRSPGIGRGRRRFDFENVLYVLNACPARERREPIPVILAAKWNILGSGKFGRGRVSRELNAYPTASAAGVSLRHADQPSCVSGPGPRRGQPGSCFSSGEASPDASPDHRVAPVASAPVPARQLDDLVTTPNHDAIAYSDPHLTDGLRQHIDLLIERRRPSRCRGVGDLGNVRVVRVGHVEVNLRHSQLGGEGPEEPPPGPSLPNDV
jgi:hypothetical protein